MDSALVELKAELKKKEELLHQSNQKKWGDTSTGGKSTFQKIHQITGKKKKKTADHTTRTESEKVEQSTSLNDEENAALAQSKQRMEEKAKLYEKMQKGVIEDLENEYGETKYLVDFEKKVYDNRSDEVDNRTNEVDNMSYVGGVDSSPTTVYKADQIHLEKMHEKWKNDEENLSSDNPVHYENIKFDEIRDLGAGYYAFSKDEETRKKQMDDLQKLRTETISKQNKKEQLIQKRKAALQERLNKIKQRKFGLDVEPESLTAESKTKGTEDQEESLKSDNSASSSQIDSYLKECRKVSKTQREWDKGKVSVGSSSYTQQNFVSKNESKNSLQTFIDEQRNERPEEFAPPNFY